MTKLTNNIKDLEKSLHKEFNFEEYFKLSDSVYSPYGNSEFNIVGGILETLGLLDKAIIAKSAYAKHMRWGDENGYGNYGTPLKQYQELWEEKLEEEDYEWLINANAHKIQRLGKDDFYKKMASVITKEMGKEKAALYILKACQQSANSAYDRNLSFQRFLQEKLEKLWGDKGEIYTIVERASLVNQNKAVLRDWLNSFKLSEI